MATATVCAEPGCELEPVHEARCVVHAAGPSFTFKPRRPPGPPPRPVRCVFCREGVAPERVLGQGVLAYPGGELRHFYGCRSCIRTLGLTETTWAAAALRVIAPDFAPAGV
jgi:hypothetical protein